MTNIKQIEEMLMSKELIRNYEPEDLLSSGSALLNLACSGNPYGAYPKGTYVFFVGDSDSGKTWYVMTLLAEAANNSHFDEYRLIYDPIEGGAQMDLEYYFGSRLAERIEAPRTDEAGNDLASEYLEDFYDAADFIFDEGPAIYIVDSMDSLFPKEDRKQVEDERKAREAGKDTSGSYGTAKAKMNSNRLRQLMPKLRASGSILVIISQTRDNIGFGAQFAPRTRSGGRALKFYSDIEIWTSVRTSVKKSVKGKPRKIGVVSRCNIARTRITGRKHTVDVPIIYRHGIDDTGSIVDWLIAEKCWNKSGKKIKAVDFDITATRDKIIEHIEDNDFEEDLLDVIGDYWDEIEKASTVKRKKKYK